MAKALADYLAWEVQSLGRDMVRALYAFNVGAAGAVGNLGGNAGLTVTKNGTGTYDLTFPPHPWGQLKVYTRSAALTIVNTVVTTHDSPAGTAKIKTVNAAGAATDPADGDTVYVEIAGFDTGLP